jgi:hypothetical protein
MIRLRDRFKPDLTEREAAKYMQGVIDNACENSMSIVYDQFQVSLLELSMLHSACVDAVVTLAVLPKQDPICIVEYRLAV